MVLRSFLEQKKIFEALGTSRVRLPMKHVLLTLLAVSFVLVGLAGCSKDSRKEWWGVFFDAKRKRPPTTRVRRDLEKEIRDLKQEVAVLKARAKERAEASANRVEQGSPLERATSWEEASELLPADKGRNVDWNKALEEKVIAPRGGVGSDAKVRAVFDLDVELASSPSKALHVTFSHEKHTPWLSCKNCHPALYPLGGKGKPTVTTMATINAGKSCGACHGKVAFGPKACARCHPGTGSKKAWKPSEPPRNAAEKAKSWPEVARLLPKDAKGAIDWSKALESKAIDPRAGADPKAKPQMVLPTTSKLVPKAGAAFEAVFSHRAHTPWLACGSCHTRLYQMSKGSGHTTMAEINAGESCGACHGKVAFGPKACARCHPALPGK